MTEWNMYTWNSQEGQGMEFNKCEYEYEYEYEYVLGTACVVLETVALREQALKGASKSPWKTG